jgi:hypothetical protein
MRDKRLTSTFAVADVVYSGNKVSGIIYQGVAIEQDYRLSPDFL